MARWSRAGPPRDTGPRINRRIRVPEVLVIAANGEKLGVMPTPQALSLAQDLGLDLVEVAGKSRPPVCRIMDFGKYKYQQRKKASEAKKGTHATQLKEVKFRPKTDTHDFNVKVARIIRFLGEGHKVKVTIRFRGREVVHPERGTMVCERVQKAVTEEGIGGAEARPRMEGRDMHMIMAPKAGTVRKKEKATKEKASKDKATKEAARASKGGSNEAAVKEAAPKEKAAAKMAAPESSETKAQEQSS